MWYACPFCFCFGSFLSGASGASLQWQADPNLILTLPHLHLSSLPAASRCQIFSGSQQSTTKIWPWNLTLQTLCLDRPYVMCPPVWGLSSATMAKPCLFSMPRTNNCARLFLTYRPWDLDGMQEICRDVLLQWLKHRLKIPATPWPPIPWEGSLTLKPFLTFLTSRETSPNACPRSPRALIWWPPTPSGPGPWQQRLDRSRVHSRESFVKA